MTCANSAPPLGLAWKNFTVSSDGKAVSRGIAVGVGKPQQIISLRPSIGDDNVWVFNAADCVSSSNSSCIGAKGGVYNSSASHTFVQTTEAAWNGTHQSNNDPSATFIYFNDELDFGTSWSIPSFPILMDQPGQGSQSGIGIGPNSTFLDMAVRTGAAPSKAWGLWVGSRSVVNPADGSLWIGGYDTSRVAGEFTAFPTYPRCPTCVQITNITYETSKGSTSLFSNSSEVLTVSLEPFSRSLDVPSDIFMNFIKASGGVAGSDPDTIGLVLFNPAAEVGNLSVTLSNGYQTVIPSRELFVPPRQYNKNGVYEISNNTYLLSEIVNSTAEPGYVLDWGVPFLTMNYMIMDYDNHSFALAPARQGPYGVSNGALIQPLCEGITPVNTSPGGVPTPTASPSAAPTSKPTSGHVGAIAGGVVGGVVGLAIIAILTFCLLRGRKREAALRQERDSVVTSTIIDQPKGDRISQYTATSPTEVSEAGAGEQGYNSMNQWLYSQEKFSTEQPQIAANMHAPFEMPASKH